MASSPSSSASATRRCILIFLILLSLFLVGTVIVLSTVTYYLAIPEWAYLGEADVPFKESDRIVEFQVEGDFSLAARANEIASSTALIAERAFDELEEEALDLGLDAEATSADVEDYFVNTDIDLPDLGSDGKSETAPADVYGNIDASVDDDDDMDVESNISLSPSTSTVKSVTTAPATGPKTTTTPKINISHPSYEHLNATDGSGIIDPSTIEWSEQGMGSGSYWMRKDWDGKVRGMDRSGWERLEAVKTLPNEKIPRLIHQTWKSDVLPEKWRTVWRECREGMEDYEYFLWTDELSREFIKEYYPLFLSMYDSYTYPIQRADAIRYFLLHRYGGIYMDLDIGCRRRLDPLLQGDWEVVLPRTKPVGVSNDLMFSSKGSAFMDAVIHGLATFDHQYLTNYPTVMFSTGPMFLSAEYGLYSAAHPLTASQPRPQIRILPKPLYGKNALPVDAPHAFFSHFYGSSWHADDAGFITFLGTWGKRLMYVGVLVVIFGTLRYFFFSTPIKSGRSHRSRGIRRLWANGQDYQMVGLDGSSDSDEAPVSVSLGSRPSSPSSSSGLSDLLSPGGGARTAALDAMRRAGNFILAAPATLLSSPTSARRNRENGGQLYFLPALFVPEGRAPPALPISTRTGRGRTASMASNLPPTRHHKRASINGSFGRSGARAFGSGSGPSRSALNSNKHSRNASSTTLSELAEHTPRALDSAGSSMPPPPPYATKDVDESMNEVDSFLRDIEGSGDDSGDQAWDDWEDSEGRKSGDL